MPDLNVWIALAPDRHIHHEPAKAWFSKIESGGAAFCRITQMGFLRLVTNRQVMGVDVVTLKEAWQVYQKFIKDERVIFLPEPAGIEEVWRKLTQGSTSATNTWTDAYLCAFASVRNLRVVSFDGNLTGADVLRLNS